MGWGQSGVPLAMASARDRRLASLAHAARLGYLIIAFHLVEPSPGPVRPTSPISGVSAGGEVPMPTADCRRR